MPRQINSPQGLFRASPLGALGLGVNFDLSKFPLHNGIAVVLITTSRTVKSQGVQIAPSGPISSTEGVCVCPQSGPAKLIW